MKSKATKALVMLCFGAFVTTGIAAPAAASWNPFHRDNDYGYYRESKSDHDKRIEKERKERQKRIEKERKEREKRWEENRKDRERKHSYWGYYDHRSQAARSRAHMGPDASH